MNCTFQRLARTFVLVVIGAGQGCEVSQFAGESIKQPSADVATAPEEADSAGEKLSPSARYLIVHADDAGMCESVNRATIDALENGAVTSASIMVPCPAFEDFAEYAARHPEHDYGVHLTLNAEFVSYRWGPVAGAAEVPSLVDGDDYLWRSEHQTAANARAEEVERELRAQIDKALEHRVPLSHLDTHMGTLFMRPDFLDIYLRLGDDYDLPILLTHDGELAARLEFDERIVARVRAAAEQFQAQGFPILDNIFMHYSWDSVPRKKRAYLDIIRNVPVGVSEIIVHCGYADNELRGITGSYTIRDGDRQVFTDPEIMDEIKEQKIRLISWKQLSEMTSQPDESE